MGIQNAAELTDHGSRSARELVVDLLNHGLRAADPYGPVHELVRAEDNGILVNGVLIPLCEGARILVVGAGKASLRVAEALEDRLGDQIADGLVIVKQGQLHDLKQIRVQEASHPLPDSSSIDAAERLLKIASSAAEDDLVLTAITGGSSSLLCLPPRGVSLQEKRALHRALLLSGAPIDEVNAVRKHVSGIKGGRLAQAALPAMVLNFTVSDVVGDQLDCVAGPVVADSSTLDDVLEILKRYDLLNDLPLSIRTILDDSMMETPKQFSLERVRTAYVMPLEAACTGARARALELGYHVEVMSTGVEGESREVGQQFGTAVSQLARAEQSLSRPQVLLACGEMTVTMPTGGGVGGPNQEAALAAAASLSDLKDTAVGFLGTDGTDGPTCYSGGLIDGTVTGRALSEGVDLSEAIAQHNATEALRELNDLIYTGHTGTNVADLLVGVSM